MVKHLLTDTEVCGQIVFGALLSTCISRVYRPMNIKSQSIILLIKQVIRYLKKIKKTIRVVTKFNFDSDITTIRKYINLKNLVFTHFVICLFLSFSIVCQTLCLL